MDTSARSQVGLTAEELKSQMYQTMQSTGVLHKLKGQLRQNMINELRGKQSKRQSQLHDKPLGSDLFAATIRNRNSKPWIQEVLDNLVLHHIKQSRYHYTLSLFQQESGLTNYSPALTNELLSHLGLHPTDLEIEDISISSDDSSAPHSSTPKQALNRTALTLWRLMEKLANFTSKQMLHLDGKENVTGCDDDKEKQSTKALTLSEKLKAIDDDMKSSYRRKYRDPNITVSMLASAIRRAEEDADRRTRIAFEEWKATELAKLRIEETRSSKQKVETRIRALEKDYEGRKTELANREKSAVERLSVHRQQLEKELHEQRQSLLRELEQIRLREDALQQKERFLDEMENVKMREIEMMKIQHEFAASTKVEKHPVLERKPSAVSTLADSLRHSQDGKQVITSKEMTEIVKEVESKAIESEQLKAQLASLQKELSTKRAQDEAALMTENKSLRNHLSQLEKEIQDVKLSQKSSASGTRAGAEAKQWQDETNDSDRRRQSQRQFELERMVQEMHVALRESNQALLKATSSTQRDPPPPVSYPTLDVKALRKSYFAPDVHFKAPLLSDRDIREYEPLDPTPLLPPKAGQSDVSSASLRFDITDRLKRLDEESEMVSQEYDKYLRKNYREAVSPRNQPQTSKDVDPEPPAFLSKSPERVLFPVEKTYFSDMAPAFLRDSPTLTKKRDAPGAKHKPTHKQTPERKTVSKARSKSPPLPLAKETQSGSHKEQDMGRQTLERVRSELPAALPALVVSKEVVPQKQEELSASAKSESSAIESRKSSISWDEGSGKASAKSEPSRTESKASSVSSEKPPNKVASPRDDDPPSSASSDVTIPPQATKESRHEKVTVSSLSTSTADDPLSLLSDGLGPDDQLSADKEMLSDEKVDADYIESVPQPRTPLSHYPFLQTQSPQREIPGNPKPIESKSGFPGKSKDSRSEDESSSDKEEIVDKDSLRLSMEDFDIESGGSSPKSKSSEEPHIDTVRRLAPLQDKDTSEQSPEKKASLPPIPAQRKLPSLPPISGSQISGSSPLAQPTPFGRADPPKDAQGGRSIFTASVGSSSSDSLEVEEAIESGSDASKSEARDASDPVFSLQKVSADLSGGSGLKEEMGYEDSFEDEDEKSSVDESAKKRDESFSGFSSVSIDLPSGKSSQHSIPPIRQIPELTSFDDDAINAALKWGEDNQLKLDSDDDGNDDVPPPQKSPPRMDPDKGEEDRRKDASKMKEQDEDDVQDDVDVFEASGSQISFESETSRKSKEDDSDFW